MKKPSIPSSNQQLINQAVKETVEIILGRRGEKVKKLPATATLSDLIAKVNELIDLLQGE